MSLILFALLGFSQCAVAKPNCVAAKSGGFSEAALPSADGLLQTFGASTPRTLRVVLYPFIPRFDAFKNEVKSRFEQKHPDIRVEIIDLTDNYYGPFAKNYIGCVEANVYELDSVFLHDFAINKKIQELPPEAAEPPSELLKNAVSGSMVNGKRYGAPHWVCGNFLFFDSSDKRMRDLRSLSQMTKVIGSMPPANRGVAVDLMGKSTLGEFYLNAAFDRYGDLEQARQHVALYDSAIKDDLLTLSRMCEAEGCRDSKHHGTPFFAEEFAEKHARAFVGYSESLAAALGASGDTSKCQTSNACLNDVDFDVEELPLDDKGAHTMSWVDSFTVDADCKDQCAKDAAEFVRFVNTDDIFLWELLPAGATPTYLLPAKASLYSNPALLAKAHLYPKLRSIIEDAAVPSALSLNEQLRNIGRQLDSDLPRH
jgi:thiamine pyridinylase